MKLEITEAQREALRTALAGELVVLDQWLAENDCEDEHHRASGYVYDAHRALNAVLAMLNQKDQPNNDAS